MSAPSLSSGLVLTKPTGETFDLSYSDLAEIADEFPIPPDLFLEILSRMQSANLDNEPLAQIRKHLVEALSQKRYTAPTGEIINDVPAAALEVLGIALLARIEASAELSWKPWMNDIWPHKNTHPPVGDALGAYLCKAPLIYSEKLGGLVFEEDKAREALAPLKEVLAEN